ncbi:MAG: RNase adapter RapZ [Desulfovibrionaceae bacterium]|nr:RNase adapter RapZ [Desulfovibrionaceae bacterium]
MGDRMKESLSVCIVTGLSGAGKSTALRVFEDLRFFTVDGLPASLAPDMIAMMRRPSMAHFAGIALGMDIRQSGFKEEIARTLETLAKKDIRPFVIFVTADVSILIQRYAQTRRPHPLEKEGMGLEAAIVAEKMRLDSVKEQADLVVDTTAYSIHDLRRTIQQRFRSRENRQRVLRVNVVSFGFKYGVPREADMVFDLRFLPNPYFVESLRPLSGMDPAVSDYVFAEKDAQIYRDKLTDLLAFLLPLMEAEGRYRVTIALGCTGGRHRSVAFAVALANYLREQAYPTSLEHRHLELG